jgi:hypothetical protein
VGGARLDYSGDVTTSTADITTFKILISSTLSTGDAAMMMMDIKNYYLGTLLLSAFLKEIFQKYNLNALAVDGWVYTEIRKGMYGLKQAVLIANQLLQTRSALFGYYRHATHLDSGCIKRGQSLSLSWWMISQLSTWASNMQSISRTLYCALMS